MEAQANQSLLRFFRGLVDPRAANAWHPLTDIPSIAITAVLCGCDGWEMVEAWGRGNLHWLETFLELPHGIPGHDTFDRVFALLDPPEFERCFTRWTSAPVKERADPFVAVDGKTLRRSWKHAWSKTPVHMVGAFATADQVVLGQVATDAKSNEITAIPRLLSMSNLGGATVTIDAMGCQREIAGQIIGRQAHYLLAVKENQPTPHRKVKTLLDEPILGGFGGMSHDYDEQADDGHGRIERRRVWVTDEVKWLGDDLVALWPGLASVIVVESTRQDLGDPGGKVSVERRYFVSSHRGADARLAAAAIRGHWGVENALHWRPGVSMNEDQCRLGVRHGAENFSRLRRIALNQLKRWEIRRPDGKILKTSLRTKQKSCGWSHKF